MSSPTILERVDQLKTENDMLRHEKTALASEVEHLQMKIHDLEQTASQLKDGYALSLTQMQASFKALLDAAEQSHHALLEASHAHLTQLLDVNAKTIASMNDLRLRYDQLKTEYNQYVKTHLTQ